MRHIVTYLKETPRKKKRFMKHPNRTPKRNSVVANEIDKNDGDVSGEDDVCAICDNGGRLLICEGKCLRSFHPTVEDGADSSCPSLGYADAEYEAIEKVEFYCKNCEHKQQQCFGCGNLGSSDELSGAEVFRCANGTCGLFYHPHCVAKLLHPGNEVAAQEHRKKIAGGTQFACPRHICHRCKELEVNTVSELKFAICRRCPRAYHRKCLPRKIAFENDVDESKGIVQRAWEGLIPNGRILIYCLKHEIDLRTSTPVRNHIKFPEPEQMESARRQGIDDELENAQNGKSMLKITDGSLSFDADKKKRILTVMENASSSVMPEKIEKHKVSPLLTNSLEFTADFTLGKVECSVEAVRAALRKLEGGGSIAEAKTFCETDLLSQVMNWKKKLRVYLAPFLNAMNYTSFGRHFIKMDKYKELVDKLHWYVHDGDMVVNFGCGSNDFSFFMKKKLNEVGKNCSFKSYDLLQAKNDFNSERKDWMEVRLNELLEGSRLIMGLHPTSDVALDDKFISRVLEFKPKLLIQIAPQGTQRLGKTQIPYELIWEDYQIFKGSSFCLPGSADGDEIVDLNANAPILYLWSNPDLTEKHKAIAEWHGHLSPDLKKKQDVHMDEFLGNKGGGNHLDNAQQTVEQETIMITNHKEDYNSYKSSSDGDKNCAQARVDDLVGVNPNVFTEIKKRSSSSMVLDKDCSNSASSHSISDRVSPQQTPSDKKIRSDETNQSTISLTNGSNGPKFNIPVRRLGFASGPCVPYSPRNSTGWLEE